MAIVLVVDDDRAMCELVETCLENHHVIFAYDGADRPVATTDALGHTRQIRYNQDGQPTAIIDAVGHVIEFRDPSWYRDEVDALLERYRVALCLHDMRGSATGPRRSSSRTDVALRRTATSTMHLAFSAPSAQRATCARPKPCSPRRHDRRLPLVRTGEPGRVPLLRLLRRLARDRCPRSRT